MRFEDAALTNLQAGSSVERGARSKYKGLVTSHLLATPPELTFLMTERDLFATWSKQEGIVYTFICSKQQSRTYFAKATVAI